MQRDLFNDPVTEAEPNPAVESEGFLHRYQVVLGMDHILLISISLIAYSCLLYGLGVWTGSRISWREIFYRPAASVQTSSVSVSADKDEPSSQGQIAAVPLDEVSASHASGGSEVLKEPEASSAMEEVKLSKVESPKGKFTIQVVAYKQLNEANRFSEKLSQKGLQSFVLTQKRYHNVCVASFISKQTARQFLAELKSQGWFPKDAYVRHIA